MNPGEPISRPLGLTLLALANFVVGGAFGIIALLAFFQLVGGDAVSGSLVTVLVSGMVLATGAVASGLGYLRLSTFLGKTIGTVFGLLVVVYVIYGLAMGQPLNVVYVIMVLFGMGNTSLVNTVYKDVFSAE
jgi:hypothetical protein